MGDEQSDSFLLVIEECIIELLQIMTQHLHPSP